MDSQSAARWMLEQLNRECCLYQEDVVDYLVKMKQEQLLMENREGNLVLTTEVTNAFRKMTESTVVWVRPEKYWRFRVREDEPGRQARG